MGEERHPDAFAAHTLQLSRHVHSRERAAWQRGYLAGLSTAVFGALGALVLVSLATL